MGRNRAKQKIQAHQQARRERRVQAKTEQKETTPGAAAIPGATGPAPTDAGKKAKKLNKGYAGDPEGLGDVDCDNEGVENDGCGDNDNSQWNKVGEASSSRNLPGEVFYAAGGNPNHRMESKPVWRYDYEESQVKTKNKGKPVETEAVGSESSARLEDYFSTDDILAIKGIRGAKMENISPSVAAVYLNRFDVLKRILKEDNSLDCLAQDGQFMSPLGCAVFTNNWEMREFILDKDYVRAVNCKDIFGNTALVKAAFCKDWTEIAFCEFLSRVEDEEIDLFAANLAGVTLLHAISYRGWITALENIKQLIESRPQKELLRVAINTAMKDGTTPLMLAADVKSERVVDLLISEGACPLDEDKAGYTALCRSLQDGNKTPLISRGFVPPISKLILSSINDLRDQGENWDFEIYLSKTMQAVTNPDAPFSCERFYRLGRFVFLFVLRSAVGGPGMLLKAKFFSKLCSAGHKHFHQIDYLYTICLTWFEILVYAEDHPIWNKFVDAFLREGGADLCLKLLQRWTSVVDCNSDLSGNPSSKQQSNKCHSNTILDPDGNEYLESLASVEGTIPSDNMALSALLPFIQLIDAAGMNRWFSKNFTAISTCYRNMKQTGMFAYTALSGDHSTRTNQKAALFLAVMSQENWTTMYRDKTDSSESWMPRDYKNKKNRNKSVQSNDTEKVFCLPVDILKPSPEMIFANRESDEEEERKNESKSASVPRPRKIRSAERDTHWMPAPLNQSAQPIVKGPKTSNAAATPNNKLQPNHTPTKSENSSVSKTVAPISRRKDFKPASVSGKESVIPPKPVASSLMGNIPRFNETIQKPMISRCQEEVRKVISSTSLNLTLHVPSPKNNEKKAGPVMRKTSCYVTAEKFRVLQPAPRTPKGMFTEPLKIVYEDVEETPSKASEEIDSNSNLEPVSSSPRSFELSGGFGDVYLSSTSPSTSTQTRTVAVQTLRSSFTVSSQSHEGRHVRRSRLDV